MLVEKTRDGLAATVQLVVTGTPDSITDPGFLRAASALEQFALEQPGVDAGISAVDIIKRINQLYIQNCIIARSIIFKTNSFFPKIKNFLNYFLLIKQWCYNKIIFYLLIIFNFINFI